MQLARSLLRAKHEYTENVYASDVILIKQSNIPGTPQRTYDFTQPASHLKGLPTASISTA